MHDSELPLDELRAAWSRLSAPAPRAEADRATQASIAWMRSAWDSLESPAPDPRVLLRHRARAERAAITSWAAAAAVIIGGIVFALQRLAPPARPGIERAVMDSTPSANKPYIAAIEPGRLEMRSGPVRLILLTNDVDEPTTDR